MYVSKRWCFTINNYTDEDIAALALWPFVYMVYGKEVGESGTPHLQGFVTFKTARRLTGMKKLHGTAHFEPTKGSSDQAATYCKKDGDFVEFGTVPAQGQRTDLQTATDMIVAGSKISEVAAELPTVFARYGRGLRDLAHVLQQEYAHDTVRGIWIVGEPGTGKSYYARQEWPSYYDKPQNKWFDGYDGQDTILIDDFDHKGTCLDHYIKRWADRYPCTGETKGGTVHLRHKRFVITSNYRIEDLWKGDKTLIDAIERRFTYYTSKKVFNGPRLNESGPGEWTFVVEKES